MAPTKPPPPHTQAVRTRQQIEEAVSSLTTSFEALNAIPGHEPYWSHEYHSKEKKRQEQMWRVYGNILGSEISNTSWTAPRNGPGTVPRRHQFLEGNYDEALAAVKQLLESLDLWAMVKAPIPALQDLDDEKREDFEHDDFLAANHIISFVSDEFQRRWNLERPTTSHNLLAALEVACKPFRLMDLPRELREHVYGYLSPHLTFSETIYVDGDDDNAPSAMIRCPVLAVLSCVSREFREAANEIFFRNNKFFVDMETRPSLETMNWFSEQLGMWRLRHLRNLNVRFGIGKGVWHRFEITFDPAIGLEANLERARDFDDGTHEEMTDYCAMIRHKKEVEGWNSTGVIEFFTACPVALRHCVQGRDIYYEDEDEEVNERDAYQVAHGKSVRMSGVW